MPDFITTQQPEVILASVCGPGASLRKEGLPLYLYAVYSFPAYVYTGFPDCSPRANPKKVAELIRDRSVPKAFKEHLTGFYIMRDDEYLRVLWRGSIWPLVALYSPVCEAFSEAGGFLLQNKDKFLARETIKRWIGSPISDEDLGPSIAWSLAEKACNGNFTPFVDNPSSVIKRIENTAARTHDKSRLISLYEERKDTLPQRMSKRDLNSVLINVRGLS